MSYFVILCGSMNYILPLRNTKVSAKELKGLFNNPGLRTVVD
jgi:hypothetical protein